MAMTAWSAKFVTSSICLSVKARTSWRKMLKAPTSSLSFIIGTTTIVRIPLISTAATRSGSRSA